MGLSIGNEHPRVRRFGGSDSHVPGSILPGNREDYLVEIEPKEVTRSMLLEIILILAIGLLYLQYLLPELKKMQYK